MALPTKIAEIAPGCFNLRAPFTVMAGMIDIGTHMSFIKLSSGKFVLLSTVQLDAQAKREIHDLTQGGDLIEAIIGTNPFHTLAFEQFYTLYPNAAYYGTPRHLRKFKEIPWAGCVTDPSVLSRWMPDLALELTQGGEFDDPQPESTNHFAGVVAIHVPSKTMIVDDCFRVSRNPGFIERGIFGRRDMEVSFHWSLYNDALYKTPGAVQTFYDWVIHLTKAYDFDNMSTAHGGILLGGAKTELLLGLEKAKDALKKMAVANGGDLPFYILGGLINVGTHMSFIRLSSGKFVAVSAVDLDAEAKAEVDRLTANGKNIESVLATNPFHTMAFEPFYALYPDARYYGTPRHIRNIKTIPWAGSVADDAVLKMYEPEIEMRIPAGAEFNDPKPEATNHFSGLVVYHRASKTLLCVSTPSADTFQKSDAQLTPKSFKDDCFSVHKDPNVLLRLATGATPNSIGFHWSLKNQALHKSPDAAKLFYGWMLSLVKDWDFENMCCAHGDGVMIGGARGALQVGLDKLKPSLDEFSVAHGGSKL
ncbi:hypothetical protein HDU78_005598 [Chytriomyces hyalinus]|nr:hypothetical protein HDU78_005598 [Chytriomyces hyalinus]